MDLDCLVFLAYKLLAEITLWKENPLRFCVQSVQQFGEDASLDPSRFFRVDEITNNRLQPGIVTRAEVNDRSLLNLQFVHGCLP